MGKIIAWVALAAGLLTLAFVAVARLVLLPGLDADMNVVFSHDPWPVSAEAARLHEDILVSDLHADTLLWSRDPAKEHDFGQTDLPRFREGGMALQVFTAVTKSPSGQNYDANSSSTDQIRTLAIAAGWPLDTWTSIEARAHYQARRLQKLEREDGRFFIIRTAEDLSALIARRARDPQALGGVLGLEGAHPFEGSIEAIDRLYNEGYRVVGLQHFFDNELGGSLHGEGKGGLTSFGRDAVEKMVEMDMILDLAHSSERVVEEVLGRIDAPVIVSHTGVNSLCDSPRNIRDELLAEVASRGGLIGIGFWDDVICDATPAGIAAAIDRSVDLFGEDAIALGSDFDGTVATYLDVSEMAAITHALLARGMDPEQIKKVMGGNQIRFFLENLPEAE